MAIPTTSKSYGEDRRIEAQRNAAVGLIEALDAFDVAVLALTDAEGDLLDAVCALAERKKDGESPMPTAEERAARRINRESVDRSTELGKAFDEVWKWVAELENGEGFDQLIDAAVRYRQLTERITAEEEE